MAHPVLTPPAGKLPKSKPKLKSSRPAPSGSRKKSVQSILTIGFRSPNAVVGNPKTTDARPAPLHAYWEILGGDVRIHVSSRDLRAISRSSVALPTDMPLVPDRRRRASMPPFGAAVVRGKLHVPAKVFSYLRGWYLDSAVEFYHHANEFIGEFCELSGRDVAGVRRSISELEQILRKHLREDALRPIEFERRGYGDMSVEASGMDMEKYEARLRETYPDTAPPVAAGND